MSFFRGRRLRRTEVIRRMVRETELRPQDLIHPFFVLEDEDLQVRNPIASMPGQFQLGLDALVAEVRQAWAEGLQAVMLFGIPKHKDEYGTQAYARDGIVQQAVTRIKEAVPDIMVITDVCLCEYTSHGHCGLISGEKVANDPSLELLTQTALSHVQAGADMVAPSDMMDGRVQAIRRTLNAEGFSDLPIMSYAVKYASAFYGPFREAAQSAPSFGDRKTYQMDPANALEGLREAEADVGEGADMLMVKPALPYLDVLHRLKERFNLPLAAYHVSGEYALIKAAGEKGWVDERQVALESLTSIKRAGASCILTYFAREAVGWIQEY
ncbi:MAG: porphobilinogen synthase [Desulfovermiculus sp.]|nr:porphobilinogen synthase [Desulfovermiculus sp.]